MTDPEENEKPDESPEQGIETVAIPDDVADQWGDAALCIKYGAPL